MPYTPVILKTAADYSMIRHLLDIDAVDLSDAIIEDYGFLPLVESDICAVITDYATILTAAGADSIRLKSGAAAWVAALIAHALYVSESNSVQIGDYQETAKTSWLGYSDSLMGQAASSLAGISTRTYSRGSLLVLGGPTRAYGTGPDDIEVWLERIQPRFIDWVEEGGTEDD